MLYAILAAAIVVLFFWGLQWKISAMAMVYYTETKNCKPSEEEVTICTNYVVKKLIKKNQSS